MTSGTYLLGYNPTPRNRKIFCIIATVMWILLSGLRGASVGADTEAYKIGFEQLDRKSWDELFRNFSDIFFQGADGKDPGYNILAKVIYTICPNYQFFLIFIACLFHIPLGIIIYKESSAPLLSWMIYSSLFYSFFAITGHRQTIATALVVLIGYQFIKKRKLICFLLLVAIASTIHASSIIFLPFYFISRVKIGRIGLILFLGTFPITYVYRNQLMSLVAGFIGYEEYTEYATSGPVMFLIVFLMIMLVIIVGAKSILGDKNSNVSSWMTAICIAFVFIPLAFVNPSAMRGVQYYSIFLILLMPETLRMFNRQDKKIVYLVCVSVLLFALVRNNPTYLFFWQK